MSWLGSIFGGAVEPIADAAGRYGESRQRSRQIETVADAATENARIAATAAAVAAGQSTWRPKWMHSLRVLVAFYFGLSFAGGVVALAALGAVFLEWLPKESWDRISPELLWLLGEWGSVGAKLIGLATLSYVPGHVSRSWEKVRGAAAGGAGIPAHRFDDEPQAVMGTLRERPAERVRRPLTPADRLDDRDHIERMPGVAWRPPERAAPPPEPTRWRLSRRSRNALEGVHPDMVRLVERALALSPIDFGVTEGLRTLERQQKLVAEGRSWTLRSRHLTGHAVDIVCYTLDGLVTWEPDAYVAVHEAFEQASAELDIPIRWGGDWKVRDYVHYELDRARYPVTADHDLPA